MIERYQGTIETEYKKKIFLKHRTMRAITILVVFLCVWFAASPSYALATSDRVDSTTRNQISGNADDDDNTLDLNITSNAGSVTLESTLQILILLTILSLAPSILIMLTSFTRIIVVFHFLRTAIGTQTTPPNQILIGLALFITFAVMSPVFNEVNTNAVQPYMAGNLTQKKALEKASEPLKTFMLKQTREKDLKLFMTINDISSDDIESFDDLSLITVIPAFIISELRTAFIIGFLLYLPFIVIDMVVASTLMSMGMMMLPPTTISLPFKILLFILADGWNLLIGQLVQSFH
ncbi:MAG: flagellar type III secretion system pore protein FliP [Lachnospiraceae bacterium]